MAAQDSQKLIRSTWYWSKNKRIKQLKNFRLYPNRLVIVTWKLFKRSQQLIPLRKIERADLSPRHKRRDMVLVIRLKSGKKILSTVPGSIYWRDTINGLLGISLLDWKEEQDLKTAAGAASLGGGNEQAQALGTSPEAIMQKTSLNSAAIKSRHKENPSLDDLDNLLGTGWINTDIKPPSEGSAAA